MISVSGRIDESVFIGEGVVITGRVSIGKDSNVWHNAVLRAEHDVIEIGAETSIQDCSVLHNESGFPLIVGDGCTIGHSVILHGCKIGNNTMIGMGSVVMNGAVIGDNCIIGAGSLVTHGTEIPDGSLVLGSPAKVIRPVNEKDIQSIIYSKEAYLEKGKKAKEGIYEY